MHFSLTECDSDDSMGVKGSPVEELRATEGKNAPCHPECVSSVFNFLCPHCLSVPSFKNASFHKMFEKQTFLLKAGTK